MRILISDHRKCRSAQDEQGRVQGQLRQHDDWLITWPTRQSERAPGQIQEHVLHYGVFILRGVREHARSPLPVTSH